MITSEIAVAYTQCKLKAYLLLCSNKKGISHEYISILEEETQKNRLKYLNWLKMKHPEAKPYSPEAMKIGIPVLLDADLTFGGLEAYADSLTKDKVILSQNSHNYTPTLVVGTHKIKKEQKFQLAFFGHVLSKFQKVKPAKGIIVGNRVKKHTIRLEPFYKEVEKILRNMKNWVSSTIQEAPSINLNKHCPYCPFQKECETKAKEQDHLSLLKGMSEKEICAQNKKGIFTVTQFSYTYRPRKLSKGKKQPVKNFRSLKALAIRDKKIYVVEKPEIPQSPTQIYLDVEGIPDRGFYYLIGLVVSDGIFTKNFSFWADNQDEEENIWNDFICLIKNYKNFTLFHYGSYETDFIQRMERRYEGGKYEEIINKIKSNMVNALTLIYAKIYFPTYSNGLKEIGVFLGYKWSEKDASGLQSLVWRHNWEVTGKEKIKNKLIQYNLEDCFALRCVIENIVIISNENSEINSNISSVENMRIESYQKWGKTEFQIPDFNFVNKCAYFSYQRDRIYLRANKNFKKIHKNLYKQSKTINKIDKYIKLQPQECPKCNHNKFYRNSRKKIVIDLEFMKNGIKKWVVQFQGSLFECCECGHKFNLLNFRETPKYGHNLMIWAINQYISYNISFRKIDDMLLESFNIKGSNAMTNHFRLILSQRYKETFEEIQNNIINGDLIHADETTANVQGFSAPYVWVFTNMDSVFYLFKPNRESNFLKDLFKGFNGVLISDFFSGYDSLPCLQQKCLIHLIRDFNDDLLKNQFNIELKNMIINFGKLLKEIIETVDKYGLKKRNLNKHKKDVNNFYEDILSKEYKTEIAIAYQERFEKTKGKLFTFLDFDGIPWNNNNSEHAIKPFAAHRRSAGYAFSEKGINEYLILLSIQQTCRYRGINFMDFLKSQETSINKYFTMH